MENEIPVFMVISINAGMKVLFVDIEFDNIILAENFAISGCICLNFLLFLSCNGYSI